MDASEKKLETVEANLSLIRKSFGQNFGELDLIRKNFEQFLTGLQSFEQILSLLESETKELETRREALSLDKKLVEDRLREVENRAGELDKREEMLGKVAKDNELKEKHLEMKQKEIEDKEKDVEGIREKMMDLRKELEKLDTVKPISDELRKKSRGREEEVDTNNGISSTTARSPKRSRHLEETNCDDARIHDDDEISDNARTEDDDEISDDARTDDDDNDDDHDSDDGDQVTNGDSIGGSESKSLFNDFEKDKLLRMGAGQVWASFYNPVEDKIGKLPRSYVRILGVLSTNQDKDKVELIVAWLNPLPRGRHVSLKLCELPVDRFVFRRTNRTLWSASPDMLSHQVYCEGKRSPFVIFPRKGEVWALYKDWDISKGASNPEIQENCKYEIVVVVASIDYKEIRFAYLDKLDGFLSLFHRRSQANSFFIVGDDLRRFSHQVPSFKMTGNEGEGVPEGSFELDPRALPLGVCSDLQHSGET